MKGELIDIATWQDEFKNTTYRITIEFTKKPPFILGEIEVKQ